MNTFDFKRVLVVLVVAALFTGCDEPEDSLPELEAPSQVQRYDLYNGYIIGWTAGGYPYIAGTYMRTFTDNGDDDFGCDLPETSCMPDVYVGGANNGSSGGNTLNLNQAELTRIQNEYVQPLLTAMQGSQMEKVEFLREFATSTPLPEEVLADMASGILTIKKFGDQHIIVSSEASHPSEIGDYEWISTVNDDGN